MHTSTVLTRPTCNLIATRNACFNCTFLFIHYLSHLLNASGRLYGRWQSSSSSSPASLCYLFFFFLVLFYCSGKFILEMKHQTIDKLIRKKNIWIMQEFVRNAWLSLSPSLTHLFPSTYWILIHIATATEWSISRPNKKMQSRNVSWRIKIWVLYCVKHSHPTRTLRPP